MQGRAWTPPLVLAVLVVGCGLDFIGPGIRGSGNVITETREVSGFDEIAILSSGDVVFEVTGTESLQIEAEDNIMPILTTKVVNGRLELGSSESYSTSRGVLYTITASEFAAVTIEGSGDVTGTRIDTDSVHVEIDGSGDVRLSGTANALVVEIAGSGSVDAFDLTSATATVKINGSGDALVNAAEHLTATINGSGNVTYVGSPTVDQTINGSGEVARR